MKYFLLYRDLIDRPRIMHVMEHDVRFIHLEIFERRKMRRILRLFTTRKQK